MLSVKTAHRLTALGQLLFLSCCVALPQAQEFESNATPSNLRLEGRVTVIAPSPVTPSNDNVEAAIVFLTPYFAYMPLLDKSLISPHRIYYGCINSDESGVILNYEIENSFEAFYPLFRDEFSAINWTYQATEIVEDDLNHRMMFLKASTTRDDSTVIDIQGTILESVTNPDRLSITVTFSHIANSVNYQYFENSPSTDWILSNPKSALLGLCSDEYWTVWNP